MAEAPPSTQAETAKLKILPPHQEAMVEVCKTGQLLELQQLFDEYGVKCGDDPVPYPNPTLKGAPETSMLFNIAISHGHQSIVRYLHSIYPTYDFSDERLAHAIIERPDLDMLKLLHSYSSNFVNLSLDDRMSSLLSMACEGGPKNADFMHFLLDHGAIPSIEGSFLLGLGGVLTHALEFNQPIAIIKKMVPKTPYLQLPILSAIERKRADALDLLLDEECARGDYSSDPSYGQKFLEHARKKEDKKVIALVERYIRKSEKQARKSNAKDLHPKTTETRKWWQRGLPADTKEKAEPEESGISNLTDGGTATSWWPLSKIQNRLQPADMHEKGKDFEDSASDEDP